MALGRSGRSRRYRTALVRECLQLTPRMRRIILDGEELADFSPEHPGQWVMLSLPGIEGGRAEARAYTIRNFDRISGRLTIDFVLHGHGPLSGWAATARPGMLVQVSDPRSNFAISDNASWLVLAGDETALPAILAMLESRPSTPRIDVFIEISDPQERHVISPAPGLTVRWILRTQSELAPGEALERELYAYAWTDLPGQVWVATESSVIQRVRKYLTVAMNIPKSAAHLPGYWKIGVADEREDESDY